MQKHKDWVRLGLFRVSTLQSVYKVPYNPCREREGGGEKKEKDRQGWRRVKTVGDERKETRNVKQTQQGSRKQNQKSEISKGRFERVPSDGWVCMQ